MSAAVESLKPSPEGVGFAQRIMGSPLAQSHDRYITTVGNTQALMGHMTWTEAEKVTAIRFKIGGGADGEIMRVVFDATPVDDITDDTQAWAWMDAAGPASSPSIDVEFNELIHGGANNPQWSDWIEFGGILRRADLLSMAGTGRTVLAETA